MLIRTNCLYVRKGGSFSVSTKEEQRGSAAPLLPYGMGDTQPSAARASSKEISSKLERLLGKETFTLLPVALMLTATS